MFLKVYDQNGVLIVHEMDILGEPELSIVGEKTSVYLVSYQIPGFNNYQRSENEPKNRTVRGNRLTVFWGE